MRILGAMVSIVVLTMIEACLMDCSLFKESTYPSPQGHIYTSLSVINNTPPSVSLTIPFGKSSATPHRLPDTCYSTLVGDQKQTWKTGIVS
jgi:hypothetical protein